MYPSPRDVFLVDILLQANGWKILHHLQKSETFLDSIETGEYGQGSSRQNMTTVLNVWPDLIHISVLHGFRCFSYTFLLYVCFFVISLLVSIPPNILFLNQTLKF